MMARLGTVMVNGAHSDNVSVFDRGLQYGDGLFETIALIDGVPQHWQLHLERLELGCQRLHLPFPGSERLREDLHALELQAKQAVLKIILTRGVGGRGYRVPDTMNPTRILYLSPWPAHPPEYAGLGVTVRLCQTRLGRNAQLAGIKHLNRLEQVLARAEWQDPDIAEGLMLDESGHLIEGTMSNVFIVSSGELHTPVLDHSGVEGVMRRIVLDHARTAGITANVRPMGIEELHNADEVFLTNSLIGIWSVRRLCIGAQTREFGAATMARLLRSQLENALPPHAA